jgi:hypothetical protein
VPPVVLFIGTRSLARRVPDVKYVLLFVETEQFNSDLAAMSQSERERAYDRVNEWFANHADMLRSDSKPARIFGADSRGPKRRAPLIAAPSS